MTGSSARDAQLGTPRAARRPNWPTWGLLAAILLVAAYFRTLSLTTWDGDSYLHPDERFIVFTAYNLQVPRSFGDYLRSDCVVGGQLPAARNPQDSLETQEPTLASGCNTLNPRNYNWSRFFVYGTLPTTLTRLVVEARMQLAGQSPLSLSPELVRNTGRALSTLFDLGSVLVVFLIGRRLYAPRVGLVAALLLALSALPIQLAHFFTVDAATVFFTLLTIYFAVRVSQGGGWGSFAGAGLAIGAAMACRITMATLGLTVMLAVGMRLLAARQASEPGSARGWLSSTTSTGLLARLALAGALTLLTFRLIQPDAFQGTSFFDVRPDERFLENIRAVSQQVSGEQDFPPGHQWSQRTPFLFPLQNMVIWGMGLPLGIASLAAFVAAGWRIVRRRDLRPLIPWFWIAFYFAWQGGQFGMTMRYYVQLYGLLALLAAWGLWALLDGPAWPRRALRAAPLLLVVVGTALWAYAFTRIYTEPHSRIEASRWIYQHIPPGSAISFEEWDDPLPLGIDGQSAGQYVGVRMSPYAEDEQAKYTGYPGGDALSGLLTQLDTADYLIFSSNRVYDSTTRMPMRFPALTRYYHHLFEGNLGFRLVADIHSYPRLFGIELPSPIYAEEAFSVYDHPRVLIFQKTPEYSRERAEQLITGDVAWGEVTRLSSLKFGKVPTALRLTSEQWPVYRAAGSWSLLFGGGLVSAAPWLFWLLAVQAIGLATFALLFRALPGLPDRGYALSKTLGLLAVAYASWLLASIGNGDGGPLLAFGKPSVWLFTLLLLAGGAAAAWAGRAALRDFWRRRRTALLTAEGLFLVAFFGFLLLRAYNPDLWHPARGGEKPMDMAFLTAVVKSPAFPPYDPWFAGGFLNYYYFGFVLIATLIHLTGIAPATAYNLAVPTLFALTALGAWGAAYNLVALRSRRLGRLPATPTSRRAHGSLLARFEQRAIAAGLAAAVFAALLGSLAQAWWFLPGTAAPEDPSLPEQCRGLSSYAGQQSCRDRREWAFWDATRLVGMSLQDGTITEFPFFTFLFADLHAHMIALPLTLAALMLSLALARSRFEATYRALRAPPIYDLLQRAAALGLLALVVGALYATNTWDYPAAVVLGALGLAVLAWRRHRRGAPLGRALAEWLVMTGVLLALARLLFLPFTQHFATEYAGFGLWSGGRTPTLDFLKIAGLWLFLGVSGALLLARRAGVIGPRAELLIGAGLLIAAAALAFLELPALLLQALLLALGVWLLLSLLLGSTDSPALPDEHGPLQLELDLFGAPHTSGRVPARRPRAGAATLTTLLWGMAGLGLMLLVEVVVARGDIGRMNTVFKLGMQSWLLLAVASGVALVWVWGAGGRVQAGLEAARTLAWRGAAALLIGAALVYPLTATPARLADRYDLAIPPTLDGAAFMRSPQATWGENGRGFTFAEDAAALEWMQASIAGTPIVLEAHLEAYRWAGRVSVYTGLPTLLGWPWHMTQQRSVADVGPTIAARQQIIRQIYDDPDPAQALRLLRLYGVEYVIVGQLEHAVYNPVGLAKFEQLAAAGQITTAFSQGQTRVYRVPPADHPPAVLSTVLPVVPPTVPPAEALLLPVRVGALPPVDEHGWNRLADSPAVAVLLWLLVWYGLAALGLPLAALVFGERTLAAGWVWARPIGLLLLGYAVWLPVAARLWQYDRWGMLLGFVLLLALNTALLARLGARRAADGSPDLLARVGDGLAWIGAELRGQRRHLLAVEALFLGGFAFLLTLRWLNPDLWQPIWGGEKPFEFGLLNAVLRSPVMPPYSPFYSDGYVNYYYYGFFLVSLPVKLTGIAPEVAYNLIVPTLFALMLVAAYALGRRIAGSGRVGLAAALLTTLVGNLAGAIPAGWARGVGAAIDALAGGVGGFGAQLGDWFVGPTRVIPNTINEFPYFSFLFADLHPHTIALPVTLLLVGLAFEVFDDRRALLTVEARALAGGRLGLAALTLGALAVTNSWDFPTYGLLLGGALLGRGWRARGPALERSAQVGAGALLGLAVGGAALLLYLPFFQSFRAMVGGVGRVGGTTPLGYYLLLYGLFLAVLLPVLFAAAARLLRLRARRTARGRGRADVSPAAAGFVARMPGLPSVLLGAAPLGLLLAGLLVVGAVGLAIIPPLLALAALALRVEPPVGVLAIVTAAQGALDLRLWLGALLVVALATLLARQTRPATWFAIWLAGVALVVSLLCELLYVRDHLDGGEWYRMNTVFKFGLQAWVLLALAAALLLPAVARGLRRQRAALQIGAGAVFATLVGLALIYPLVGTVSRTAYRFPGNTTPATLDGLAFFERESFALPAYLTPEGSPPIVISLRHDGEAQRWLDENLRGTPVVLQTSVEFYRAYGVRIAANTGFPTIVSPLHESEQRDPDAVNRRDLDVQAIYRTADVEEALRLLSRYHVGYVYVGPIERAVYGEAGAAKFDQLVGSYLSVAFQNDGVTIYRVEESVYSLPKLPPVERRAPPPMQPAEGEPPPAELPPTIEPPAPSPDEAARIAQLEQQLAVDPTAAPYAYELAELYRMQARFDEAAAVLAGAAQAHPQDVGLHHLWGDVLLDAGRYDEALAAYRLAIKADPSSGNYNKLGLGMVAAGRDGDAEQTFREAIGLDPGQGDPYFNLGQLYERRGDTQRAVAMYEQYLVVTLPDAPYRQAVEEALARLR